jgi:hypothetical protein
LSSIAASADERVLEWRRRLCEVDAPRSDALDLYVGDHWHAVTEAYKLACKFSSRTELWVISAGYGLIASSDNIKAYSATFASGNADSVWRAQSDGARQERLQRWWQTLGHNASLEDLLPRRGDGAMVIAAGAAYLTAIHADLEAALASARDEECVSVISAGTRENAALLPVTGQFRTAVGGTDSALNARTLGLLAATAEQHRFRRAEMAKLLERLMRTAPATVRRRGRAASDAAIKTAIRTLRRRQSGISRTRALRELRGEGTACEQDRFAKIWAVTSRL